MFYQSSRDLVRSFKILDISFALDPVKKIFWDRLYIRNKENDQFFKLTRHVSTHVSF